MSTKILDKAGLEYFWTKLKSYIAGLLASKADDSDVVHIVGTETVTGAKTFSSTISGDIDGNAATATLTQGVYFVVPNETSTTATLTATVTGITELRDGLMIALRMPFNTAASSTLNINSLGAKPIYYKVDTASANYYPANTLVLLVYETTTLSTGCFKMVYSYDSNTNNATAQNIRTNNATYPILMGYTANATANMGNRATYFCKDVKLNPSTGIIVANGFTGDLTGNASTASAIAWSGITSKPTTLSGYGITDAKIANGTITLGSGSLAPIPNATIDALFS